MNVTEIYHIGGRGEIYSLTDKILNNFNERELPYSKLFLIIVVPWIFEIYDIKKIRIFPKSINQLQKKKKYFLLVSLSNVIKLIFDVLINWASNIFIKAQILCIQCSTIENSLQ